MLRRVRIISNKLFRKIVDKYEDKFIKIKPMIQKANIKMLYKSYISVSLFLSLLAFILFMVLFTVILYFYNFDIILSFAISFSSSVLISLGTFLFMWNYPAIRLSQRRRNINSNLPFALIHMSAIASSGARPYTMFKIIGNSREYGELSIELSKIIRNIDVFGLDLLTAIKDVADKTPSEDMRDILMGIYTNIQGGGNLGKYLKEKSDEFLFSYRMNREKEIRTISTFADFYTALVIAAPLLIIIILSILNTLGGTIFGLAINDVLKISIFIGIPLANIIFLIILYLIEGVQYE